MSEKAPDPPKEKTRRRTDDQHCNAPDCGMPLTAGQAAISQGYYGMPLCHRCMKYYSRIG